MIPKRIQLIIFTFSLSLLLYIDRICISAAKSPISQNLQLSDTQMGMVLSAFALGYALFQTPSGMLIDRYGPRRILTGIIFIWSLFTALTGAAFNYITLIITRFLFGAGEAGAFPGISRAVYSWFPLKERGLVTGINFSGSRIGAAFALPAIAWLISHAGWRASFFILGVTGVLFAVLWYWWFRDDPEKHPCISEKEKEYIITNRQNHDSAIGREQIPLNRLFLSGNLWLAMIQYFGSNFIFFFCLTWMFPYLEKKYNLPPMTAGILSMFPLLSGALGNWVSGFMVDAIYKKGYWKQSRMLPAIFGFILVITGLSGIVNAYTPIGAIISLSIAIFGADMTLSPSWSFCVDIGKKCSGAVSGTMNMAGNIGSMVTAIAFPLLAKWFGSEYPFFYLASALALISIICWLFMKPDREIVNIK